MFSNETDNNKLKKLNILYCRFCSQMVQYHKKDYTVEDFDNDQTFYTPIIVVADNTMNCCANADYIEFE